MDFFTGQDLFLIGFLAFLEGILSIDNALVLAMMCRHLPAAQQKRALTYGLGGAVLFRLLSLSIVTYLMKWTWIKFVGGGYLLFIGLRSLLKGEEGDEESGGKQMGFWKTVLMIELMDIAFAVDSILAAVALTNKFWIVFTGGMLGVLMMRYAASVFLVLLKKFPKFETTAYLLIVLIGAKLILEGFHFEWLDFHDVRRPEFIIFWSLMGLCVLSGFRKDSKDVTPKSH